MAEAKNVGGRNKKLVIMQFYDQDVESDALLVETELTEQELGDLVDEIKNNFFEEGYEDWTYQDLIQELEKRSAIRVLEVDSYYKIYA